MADQLLIVDRRDPRDSFTSYVIGRSACWPGGEESLTHPAASGRSSRRWHHGHPVTVGGPPVGMAQQISRVSRLQPFVGWGQPPPEPQTSSRLYLVPAPPCP